MSKAKRRDRDDSRPRIPRFLSKSTLRDDLYHIASDPTDRVFEPVFRSLPDYLEPLEDRYYTAVRSTLQDVEDRRTYYPGGRSQRPAQGPRRHPKISHSPLLSRSRPIAAFKAPPYVAICVRRKVRDQVLHALGKTGKGSRFNKKPRRNQHSDVRC